MRRPIRWEIVACYLATDRNEAWSSARALRARYPRGSGVLVGTVRREVRGLGARVPVHLTVARRRPTT